MRVIDLVILDEEFRIENERPEQRNRVEESFQEKK